MDRALDDGWANGWANPWFSVSFLPDPYRFLDDFFKRYGNSTVFLVKRSNKKYDFKYLYGFIFETLHYWDRLVAVCSYENVSKNGYGKYTVSSTPYLEAKHSLGQAKTYQGGLDSQSLRTLTARSSFPVQSIPPSLDSFLLIATGGKGCMKCWIECLVMLCWSQRLLYTHIYNFHLSRF